MPFQTAEDRWQEDRTGERRVVHLAAALTGVSEQSVRPSLTRCRGEPTIRYAEAARERAQHRQLFRDEMVHHVAWLRRLPVRWLSHVVVDETIHPRHAVRVKTVDLHGHVFEQLAGIRIRNRRFLGRQRFRVPDRNLLYATVVAVPGIALVAPQSVKVSAVAVEPAKHAVEGSVLQHEND